MTSFLQRQLIEALERQDTVAVQAHLANGADPKFGLSVDARQQLNTDPVRGLPAYVAVKANFIAGLEALHHAGWGIDAPIDPVGMTAFQYAANYGRVDAGRWLLHRGADVQHKNAIGEYALSLALTYGHVDFADMVLHERPRCRENHLEDVAKRVLSKRNFLVAHWLLQQGISPNTMVRWGRSWLGVAQSKVLKVTRPLVDLLLQSGADVNLADHKDGDTPLHRAINFGVVESVLQLLHAGADPDIANENGHTARHLVMEMGEDGEIRKAFVAWEASRKAHEAIIGASRNVIQPL